MITGSLEYTIKFILYSKLLDTKILMAMTTFLKIYYSQILSQTRMHATIWSLNCIFIIIH